MEDEMNGSPDENHRAESMVGVGGIWVFVVGLAVICCIGILGIGLFSTYIYTAAKENVIVQFGPNFQATAAALPEWSVVFRDDFSKTSGKWNTGQYSGNGYDDRRVIKNGVFSWKIASNADYIFTNFPVLERYSNVYYAVDAKHVAGDEQDKYGLAFRHTQGSFYIFGINNARAYSVFVKIVDTWFLLIEETYSPAIIPQGLNRLSVHANGDTFYLFINGELVNSFRDDRLLDGEFGMFVEPRNSDRRDENGSQDVSHWKDRLNSEVEFDNFELRAPPDSEKEPSQVMQLPPVLPVPGKIVFASDRDGDRDIYVINSDGSGRVQITNDPADDYAPKWSPDGSQMVFVSNRDGNAELYLIDADGENLVRLTDNAAEDTAPDWSPDGSHIVFVSTRDEQTELYLMDISKKESGVLRLTKNELLEDFPAWSPDGGKIMFQAKRKGNGFNLYTITADGQEQKNLKKGHIQPAWSPVDNRIAYVWQQYTGRATILVWNMDVDLDEEYFLLERLKENLYPAWSPKGEQIVFSSDRDGQIDLYIVNAEGTGIFRLTHTESMEESPDWVVP